MNMGEKVITNKISCSLIDRIYHINKKINITFISIPIFQILPSSVDMLREFPGQNLKVTLPSLQFIYWALVHVEQSTGQQVVYISIP